MGTRVDRPKEGEGVGALAPGAVGGREKSGGGGRGKVCALVGGVVKASTEGLVGMCGPGGVACAACGLVRCWA